MSIVERMVMRFSISSKIILWAAVSFITIALAQPALAGDQYYDYGVALFNKRDFSGAEKYFDMRLKRAAKDANAAYYKAACVANLGEPQKAKGMFEFIVEEYPNTVAAQMALANIKKIDPQYSKSPSTNEVSASFKNEVTSKTASQTQRSVAQPLQSFSKDDVSKLVVVVRPLRDHPNVDSSSITAVKDALNKFPPPILQLLKANGVKVMLTPSVYDKDPELSHREGRGFHGGTYKSCGGYYSTDEKCIVLPEHKMSESDESLLSRRSGESIVKTLYHECGHAVDFLLSGAKSISDTEEYKHAFRLDAAKATPEAAQSLQYYLQKAEGGPEESCAELIGVLLGSTNQAELLKETFPGTIKVLRQKLKL